MERSPSPAVTLMTLPPEIRNRIYNFILGPSDDLPTSVTAVTDPSTLSSVECSYDVIKVDRKPRASGPFSFHFVKPTMLSILLVSRQVYAEAIHIFYSTNRLYFPDTELLYRFLRNIGYTRQQHLTKIYFCWRGISAKESFRPLKTCRRLKIVHFTVPCSEPPGYAAVREIRGLEEAVVYARIHYDKPLSWRSDYSSNYACECSRRQQGEGPLDDIAALERAMTRLRPQQYALDPNEKFDLFKGRREIFKRLEKLA